MAIYHLHARYGSRSSGRSAAAKSAYVLREGRYRRGAAELSWTAAGNMPEWAAGDPRLFWAAADRHERSGAILFREIHASLPRELDEAARRRLAERFAEAVCGEERLPWTLAIHHGGGSNPHLHLMLHERGNDGIARGPELWFRRANGKHPERGGARKTRRCQSKGWLLGVREDWARLANAALAEAGLEARIDHRTLAAQGIDREPVHQSRSSLALESADPDNSPGAAPSPAPSPASPKRERRAKRRRRRKRRQPGETPTSETAMKARERNARRAALRAEAANLEAEIALLEAAPAPASEPVPSPVPPSAELDAAREAGAYRGPDAPEEVVVVERRSHVAPAEEARPESGVFALSERARHPTVWRWLLERARRVLAPFASPKLAEALRRWAVAGREAVVSGPEIEAVRAAIARASPAVPKPGPSPASSSPSMEPPTPADGEILAARRRVAEFRTARERREAETRKRLELMDRLEEREAALRNASILALARRAGLKRERAELAAGLAEIDARLAGMKRDLEGLRPSPEAERLSWRPTSSRRLVAKMAKSGACLMPEMSVPRTVFLVDSRRELPPRMDPGMACIVWPEAGGAGLLPALARLAAEHGARLAAVPAGADPRRQEAEAAREMAPLPALVPSPGTAARLVRESPLPEHFRRLEAEDRLEAKRAAREAALAWLRRRHDLDEVAARAEKEGVGPVLARLEAEASRFDVAKEIGAGLGEALALALAELRPRQPEEKPEPDGDSDWAPVPDGDSDWAPVPRPPGWDF